MLTGGHPDVDPGAADAGGAPIDEETTEDSISGDDPAGTPSPTPPAWTPSGWSPPIRPPTETPAVDDDAALSEEPSEGPADELTGDTMPVDQPADGSTDPSRSSTDAA